MSTTGKKFIATKIFDKNCDLCKHMSKHDRAAFEEFPEIAYQELDLEDVINHQGNPTKFRIYQLLERYALNPDYTLDLPAYLILTKQGAYKGHHIGSATIAELRDQIKVCLEDIPDSE
jgi:hypothetical protein